jgi:hypothetical protein
MVICDRAAVSLSSPPRLSSVFRAIYARISPATKRAPGPAFSASWTIRQMPIKGDKLGKVRERTAKLGKMAARFVGFFANLPRKGDAVTPSLPFDANCSAAIRDVPAYSSGTVAAPLSSLSKLQCSCFHLTTKSPALIIYGRIDRTCLSCPPHLWHRLRKNPH